MPERVSILEVRSLADEAWGLAKDAIEERKWSDALSEIATSQSYLWKLRRRIVAEQERETKLRMHLAAEEVMGRPAVQEIIARKVKEVQHGQA